MGANHVFHERAALSRLHLSRTSGNIMSSLAAESCQAFGRTSSQVLVTKGLGEPMTFISHATADRAWVDVKLLPMLKENGLKYWYSPSSISTAKLWEREIHSGLQMCTSFILVATPAAAHSEWVKDEVYWAVLNRRDRLAIVIPGSISVSLLYDIHIRLPRIQHVALEDENSASYQLAAMVEMLKCGNELM